MWTANAVTPRALVMVSCTHCPPVSQMAIWLCAGLGQPLHPPAPSAEALPLQPSLPLVPGLPVTMLFILSSLSMAPTVLRPGPRGFYASPCTQHGLLYLIDT